MTNGLDNEITPYSLTPEGEKLLEGAQAVRRAIAYFARAQRDQVKLLRLPEPGIVKLADAMEKMGLDPALLDDLLDELEGISGRGCRVFELHFFAGVPLEEMASLMRVPERTAQRDWSVVKAWLYAHLKKK